MTDTKEMIDLISELRERVPSALTTRSKPDNAS
jgi:hypothetical protein